MTTKKHQKAIKVSVLASLFVILVAIIVLAYSGNNLSEYEEKYTITSSDISDTLVLTGRLLPQKSIDLRFNEQGEIKNIFFEEGASIKKGELFAELSHALLDAELNEINAQIETKEASLAITLAGPRDEDIAEQASATELAELQREHAIINLESDTRDAISQSDNAVRNVVDDFFLNPRSQDPKLSFPLSKNQSLKLSLESERRNIEKLLTDWQEHAIDMNLGNYIKESSDALFNLNMIREFLRIAALAVNSAESSQDIEEGTIRTWKTNLANQRTAIDNAVQSIQSGQQSVSEKNLTLTKAESSLQRLQNGSTPEEIFAKRAEIKEVAARKKTVLAKIQNRKIYSRLGGVLAEIKKDEGEVVTAQDTIGTLVSENNFEVELEVPELNIIEINKNDVVRVSFAALPGKVFRGKINNIAETAETGSNLVPYYKVTVNLEDPDPSLRSGLIADVVVITDTYKNVLSIPVRFIKTKEGKSLISVLDKEGKSKETPIETGFRGNGVAIITSSIQEGTEVILEK